MLRETHVQTPWWVKDGEYRWKARILRILRRKGLSQVPLWMSVDTNGALVVVWGRLCLRKFVFIPLSSTVVSCELREDALWASFGHKRAPRSPAPSHVWRCCPKIVHRLVQTCGKQYHLCSPDVRGVRWEVEELIRMTLVKVLLLLGRFDLVSRFLFWTCFCALTEQSILVTWGLRICWGEKKEREFILNWLGQLRKLCRRGNRELFKVNRCVLSVLWLQLQFLQPVFAFYLQQEANCQVWFPVNPWTNLLNYPVLTCVICLQMVCTISRYKDYWNHYSGPQIHPGNKVTRNTFVSLLSITVHCK